MKKLVVGVIIGSCISLSASAYANNIIGQKIQGTYPISIDGIFLSNEAIVVNGTSYVPVRTASEKFGYDVKFESKKIFLVRKEYDNNSTGSGSNSSSSSVGSQSAEIETILKSAKEYPVKIANPEKLGLGDTPLRDVNNVLVELDGEKYIIAGNLPFVKGIDYNIKERTLTYTYPESTYKVLLIENYQKGVDGFSFGRSYVKPSSIGLDAEVKEGILWLKVK